MTTINNAATNSDIQSLTKIIRNAGYETISIKGICERDEFDRFLTTHHLYVRVAKETIIHYIFSVGNGVDYLDRTEVLNQSFEQTMLEVWAKASADGQAFMNVSPC